MGIEEIPSRPSESKVSNVVKLLLCPGNLKLTPTMAIGSYFSNSNSSSKLLFKVCGNKIPIYQVPECVNVFSPGIPVVDVVSVFPYITGE